MNDLARLSFKKETLLLLIEYRCEQNDHLKFEPPHDKTNKVAVRPAKTQISPGWSESSLGAQSLCWFCHEAAHLIESELR